MTRITPLIIATTALAFTTALSFAQTPATTDGATATQVRAMAQRQVQDPTLGHDPAVDPIRATAQAMRQLHQQDAAMNAATEPAAQVGRAANLGRGQAGPAAQAQPAGMMQQGARHGGADASTQGERIHQQLHEPGTGQTEAMQPVRAAQHAQSAQAQGAQAQGGKAQGGKAQGGKAQGGKGRAEHAQAGQAQASQGQATHGQANHGHGGKRSGR